MPRGGPANCPESGVSGIGELRAASRKRGSLGCSGLVRDFRPLTQDACGLSSPSDGTDGRDNTRLIPAMPALGKRILVYPRCIFQRFDTIGDTTVQSCWVLSVDDGLASLRSIVIGSVPELSRTVAGLTSRAKSLRGPRSSSGACHATMRPPLGSFPPQHIVSVPVIVCRRDVFSGVPR